MDQAGQGDYEGQTMFYSDNVHPSNRDIMWADPGVSSGIITDMAAIEAVMASNNFLVEESNRNDHDNDGISDLYDLDDDNDGIYDLIERFDGCYGTDPFDGTIMMMVFWTLMIGMTIMTESSKGRLIMQLLKHKVLIHSTFPQMASLSKPQFTHGQMYKL